MARNPHLSHGVPGILGVFRSDPEVTAVFPELSATVIPHAQEIRVHRGDAVDIHVQLQDDLDPPNPFSLSGGILRWAAKIGYGKTEREGVTVGNEGALIVKRSYDPSGIEFISGGKAVIHVSRDDTVGLPFSPAVWDLEATAVAEPVVVPPTARAQLLAGSDTVIAGPGTNWEQLGAANGYLLTIQGRTVMVLNRLSPAHLVVDFSGWTTAPSEAFTLSRGRTRTVASGPFTVEGDVVR